jgi:hypothetical protein
MKEKTTKKEAGRKGGITKWARIPKEERSAMMRKVAEARYGKPECETCNFRSSNIGYFSPCPEHSNELPSS